MNTPMDPVSPYGSSKLFSYKITQNYRNAYNIHATMEFYLITKVQEEVKHLFLEK